MINDEFTTKGSDLTKIVLWKKASPKILLPVSKFFNQEFYNMLSKLAGCQIVDISETVSSMLPKIEYIITYHQTCKTCNRLNVKNRISDISFGSSMTTRDMLDVIQIHFEYSMEDIKKGTFCQYCGCS